MIRQIIVIFLALTLALSALNQYERWPATNSPTEIFDSHFLEIADMDVVGTWEITQLALEPRVPVNIGPFELQGCNLEITEDASIYLNDEKMEITDIVASSCRDFAESGNYVFSQVETLFGSDDLVRIHLCWEHQVESELSLIISSEGLFVSTGEYFTNRGIYKTRKAAS